jgi:hypothetical protein
MNTKNSRYEYVSETAGAPRTSFLKGVIKEKKPARVGFWEIWLPS